MAGIQFSNWDRTPNPAFTNDFLNREHLLAGGARLDTSGFFANSVTVTVSTDHAEGATELNLDAAPGVDIPAGTVMQHEDGGYVKLRNKLRADETVADIFPLGFTITMETDAGGAAIPESFDWEGREKVVIEAGTLLSRTYAQRDAGDPFHDAVDGEDEYYLTAFDVVVDKGIDRVDVTLLRHGTNIKENRLPEFAGLTAAQQTAIRDNYETTEGLADYA